MEHIILNYDNNCDSINTERLKNKKIKNFISYQNTGTDRYVIIVFDDDTYITVGMEYDEDDCNEIIFNNINPMSLLVDFYKSPDSYIYTKRDGTIIYPDKIKKLLNAGIIETDNNLAEYLKSQALRAAKIEDYKKYLYSEYKFSVSFASTCYDLKYNNSYFRIIDEDAKSILSNMEFNSPAGMIMILVENCDYDPYTFSLDIEMSNKELIKQYNPYITWHMFCSDIFKQWNIDSLPDIDPIKLVTCYVDNGDDYQPGDSEQVKNWKINHNKLFPYRLLSQMVLPKKISEGKYKLTDEKIDEIISKLNKLKIYFISK